MNIFAYGDSFTSDDLGDAAPGWVRMVGDKINACVINKAVAGGSTEVAFLRFVNDCQNSLFSSGDLIIFQTSTAGRLHFQYQIERPETGAKYLHSPSKFFDNKDHSWYYKNKKFIEWYLVNYSNVISELNCISYNFFIKNFAENNPNLKVVLIQSEVHYYSFPYAAMSDNFYAPNFCLCPVSFSEMTQPTSYDDFIKYSTWDVRVNHLTTPNLKKMANLVCDFYTKNKKLENFENYFLDKCIDIPKNMDDYKKYVDLGLLYNHPFRGFNNI